MTASHTDTCLYVRWLMADPFRHYWEMTSCNSFWLDPFLLVLRQFTYSIIRLSTYLFNKKRCLGILFMRWCATHAPFGLLKERKKDVATEFIVIASTANITWAQYLMIVFILPTLLKLHSVGTCSTRTRKILQPQGTRKDSFIPF